MPPDMVQQVGDFTEFLLEKRAAEHRGKLALGRAGALEDLKEEYSSVRLQRQANKWRVEA